MSIEHKGNHRLIRLLTVGAVLGGTGTVVTGKVIMDELSRPKAAASVIIDGPMPSQEAFDRVVTMTSTPPSLETSIDNTALIFASPDSSVTGESADPSSPIKMIRIKGRFGDYIDVISEVGGKEVERFVPAQFLRKLPDNLKELNQGEVPWLSAWAPNKNTDNITVYPKFRINMKSTTTGQTESIALTGSNGNQLSIQISPEGQFSLEFRDKNQKSTSVNIDKAVGNNMTVLKDGNMFRIYDKAGKKIKDIAMPIPLFIDGKIPEVKSNIAPDSWAAVENAPDGKYAPYAKPTAEPSPIPTEAPPTPTEVPAAPTEAPPTPKSATAVPVKPKPESTPVPPVVALPTSTPKPAPPPTAAPAPTQAPTPPPATPTEKPAEVVPTPTAKVEVPPPAVERELNLGIPGLRVINTGNQYGIDVWDIGWGSRSENIAKLASLKNQYANGRQLEIRFYDNVNNDPFANQSKKGTFYTYFAQKENGTMKVYIAVSAGQNIGNLVNKGSLLSQQISNVVDRVVLENWLANDEARILELQSSDSTRPANLTNPALMGPVPVSKITFMTHNEFGVIGGIQDKEGNRFVVIKPQPAEDKQAS